MKKALLLLLWYTLSQADRVMAQSKTTFNGYVRDAANGEGLIGASVRVKGRSIGLTTNEYGYFSLTVPVRTDTLLVSYVGFREEEIPLADTPVNQVLIVRLQGNGVQMQEVNVTSDRPAQRIHSLEMSATALSMSAVKAVPTLLGEVDIVRTIQLLPGVTSVGEGATGFNVRGGGVDQNLVLLDEAPVYNSSHLMGFFSVFNPDAVKDVKLVKGGVPAQYGGRLSSVLDVRMKEGNSRRFEASGGIGTLSSRLTLEGPIVKEKASFLIAGRRSYSDLVVRLSGNDQLRQNSVYFYDLSAKLNYRISAKDRIYGSFYSGKDVFHLDFGGKKVHMEWGNRTANLRWNHLFSKRLFANFTGVYSAYDYQVIIPQEAQGDISIDLPKGIRGAAWTSGIRNYHAKADFTFYLNPLHTVTFGGSFIRYRFEPGALAPAGDSPTVHILAMPARHSREYALYAANEQTLGSRWALQYGLRLSGYDYLGPQTVQDYVPAGDGPKTPTNARTVGRGGVIQSYYQAEPRFSLRYTVDALSSVKASYNRMAQYIHLISNTTAASPLDNWSPSTNNIQPELADQVAIGYFRNLRQGRWEVSAEAYYKVWQNAIDYRNSAEIRLNPELEADLLYGRGRSYGLEGYARKHQGRLTGWISYTLSRTELKIDGLSNNDWYAAKYDRRHVGSVVGTYALSKRWSFSANFAYSTGIATSAPNARYEVDGGSIVVPINVDNRRNNFRLPAYHRLDLSATWQNRRNAGRRIADCRWQGEWVFSLYNVYARRNPFSLYFEQNDGRNTRQTNAVRIAILGTILPSVTYNFRF